MQRKPYRRLAGCALSLSLALATGCSSAAGLTRADKISVASDPPGAAVHAAGKRLGVTPLAVRQQDVFPVVYGPEQRDVYGTLMLSKGGCKDHTVRVNNAVIRNGVNATLDCGQADLAKPQPGAPGTPPPTIRERLLRLNELRDQGLVNEEEYREIRRKILGEL